MSNVNLTGGFSTGIYGMQLASQNMQRSAQQIAAAGMNTNDVGTAINTAITGGANTLEPLIDLRIGVLMFNASAKVVETSDEMIGSLLDVRV